MTRDIVGRAVNPIRVAGLRPCVHRLFGQTVHRLNVGLAGLAQANLAEIEDRDLELDRGAAAGAVRAS
jgi:hypothetical protein